MFIFGHFYELGIVIAHLMRIIFRWLWLNLQVTQKKDGVKNDRNNEEGVSTSQEAGCRCIALLGIDIVYRCPCGHTSIHRRFRGYDLDPGQYGFGHVDDAWSGIFLWRSRSPEEYAVGAHAVSDDTVHCEFAMDTAWV